MSAEATESSSFYEFLAWLELNKKRVVMGVAVVALIVVVVAYMTWSRNQREMEANRALFQLTNRLNAEGMPAAPAPSDYLKIAQDYSGTSVAARARLLAAGALFSDSRYAEALTEFTKFREEYRTSPMAPIADIGQAACYESLDRLDEALKAYQDIAQRLAKHPAATQAKLALGRIYEAKKQPAQALQAYDDVLGLSGRSSWTEEARTRREQLLLQFPDLVKTNPPAATGPVTNQIQASTTVVPSNTPAPAATNPPASAPAKTNAPAPAAAAPAPATNPAPPK